jgi:UDP-N-acetylmuramyl pentapeptide phosphotransferase/UDP-N-acetylglucosamine-1-phosphate transferase
MEYLLVTASFFLLMLLYFRIANKYNIIDKPNERSSHTEITLRGGGIIYPIAFFFFLGYEFLFNHYGFSLNATLEPNFLIFGAGLLLICTISFVDDLMDLSSKIRLVFHFISVTLLLYFLNAFQLLPLWSIPICYILIIGILNAYNFMDGINGISGLYSIAVLSSLLYVNHCITVFVADDFIIYPILASFVFLFFNFRKKAKCFLGDIGSMGISFWIMSLLGLLIIKTNDFKYIFFLFIYGVDVIITILERLKLKENIFKPHRRHLYQLFANEKKVDHRIISFAYALSQIIVNLIIIKFEHFGLWSILFILLFVILYIYLKLKIKSKLDLKI